MFRVAPLVLNAGPAVSHGIRRVGVIGAGQMGIGIAQVAAQIGKLPVVVAEPKRAQVDKQVKAMDAQFAKDIAKGKVTEADAKGTKERLQFVDSLDGLNGCDIVIEAATENTQLKLDLFRQLCKVVDRDAILATNTSSISITKIAAATDRNDKVIGMHFMNPVPVMKLVEIIPGLATSPDTLARTLSLAQALGKTTAQSRDVPGFIANRLLMPYINEAVFALSEGLGTREDIDVTMRLGMNHPMGPLTLADFIGLDTCLAIMNVLHEQLGDPKYRPSPMLIQYVDAGFLGRKTGRGFYTHAK